MLLVGVVFVNVCPVGHHGTLAASAHVECENVASFHRSLPSLMRQAVELLHYLRRSRVWPAHLYSLAGGEVA
jgi:hypothetical protein